MSGLLGSDLHAEHSGYIPSVSLAGTTNQCHSSYKQLENTQMNNKGFQFVYILTNKHLTQNVVLLCITILVSRNTLLQIHTTCVHNTIARFRLFWFCQWTWRAAYITLGLLHSVHTRVIATLRANWPEGLKGIPCPFLSADDLRVGRSSSVVSVP